MKRNYTHTETSILNNVVQTQSKKINLVIVLSLATAAVGSQITRISAAEMAVRYAALSACRKVHP